MGKIFGGIPLITEDIFVVVFDEIERAKLDEVYRLVEIIERFKNEGRTGLPVRLVFFVCLDPDEFENVLHRQADDPNAILLEGFFFNDPKSFTDRIFLPPHSMEAKNTYLLTKSEELVKRYQLKNLPAKLDPFIVNSPAREDEFEESQQKALGNMLDILSGTSPRVLNRALNSVQRTYASLARGLGPERLEKIRLADLLAMEYIKIRFPYLFQFFAETNGILKASIGIGQTNAGWGAYFIHSKLRDRGIKDIFEWIKDVTGKEIDKNDKSVATRLLSLVYDYGIRWIEADQNYDNITGVAVEMIYEDACSLSSSINMHNYLVLYEFEKDIPTFRQVRTLYKEHKQKALNLQEIENILLLQYARFLYDVSPKIPTPIEMHIDLLKELTRRVIATTYNQEKYALMDSARTDATYRVIFETLTLIEYAEQKTQKKKQTEYYKIAWDNLKEIFVSSAVSSDIKLQILDSFVNTEKGSGSSIHRRLVHSFKILQTLYAEEMKEVLQHVFDEIDERYISKGEDIYAKEESPIFVIFQNWSTNQNNFEEIEKIRSIGRKHIYKHPDAIKRYYWDNFPIYDDSNPWDGYEDVLNTHSLAFDTNLNGDEVKNNKAFQEKINTLKSNDVTLRSLLTEQGFLLQKSVPSQTSLKRDLSK